MSVAMQGNFGGGRNSNHPEMTHKTMFLRYILDPILDSFFGLFDYFTFKLLVICSSLPALFALDLFKTPSDWWKGLIWLVIFDWISGVIAALARSDFNIRVMTKKWYMVTGYFIVCGSAAILSNTFDLFYYFQFVVYASFFLKEFISILRTFHVLAYFSVMWEALVSGKFDFNKFDEFKKEVNRRAQVKDEETTTRSKKYEGSKS